MTDLVGKNVLVTGAVSGIGRLMVHKIAAAGGRVILWDVNEEGLTKVEDELRRDNYKASCYTCDLTDRQSIYETAKQTLVDCGAVDVLINNAGIVSGKNLLQISDEDIERTFAVNTLALFWMTRAFLPAMVERDSGHIVNVASAGGLVATAKMSDYCASKFAVVGFDEALRLELKRQGSQVMTTVVCPFYVNTGMFAGVKSRFPLLLPILEPEAVANRVVEGLRKNHRRIVLPWFVYTTWLVRLLPVPVFDRLMDFFGVTKSMDEFTGRAGRRST